MVMRYIACMKWDDIFLELHASKPAVMKWHRDTVASLILPENPLNVEKELAAQTPG